MVVVFVASELLLDQRGMITFFLALNSVFGGIKLYTVNTSVILLSDQCVSIGKSNSGTEGVHSLVVLRIKRVKSK
jgi:hypothetical protein